MPSSSPRRGNPWRDCYGQFCSRRTALLIDVARAAGLDGNWVVMAFVGGANGRGLTAREAQNLSPEQVYECAALPQWARDNARRVLSPTRTLLSVVPRPDWSTALDVYTNEEILANPIALRGICEAHGLTVHRIDVSRVDSVRYWLQCPRGDRYAIRASDMGSFLGVLRDRLSNRDIVRWLDGNAFDVDYHVDRLCRLLDTAQTLGIPNYETGADRDLDSYTHEDTESLEAYVGEWADRARRARDLYVDSVEAACTCTECQFVRYEISYGEMLRQRDQLNGTTTAIGESFRNVRVLGAPAVATAEDMAWRPTGFPTRVRWFPAAEGYYNEYGDWVAGRRPAAETRRPNNNADPRQRVYDGFDSPENAHEDDEEDEQEGGYSRANEYGIERWDYRVPVRFNGESAFGTYFGMELEISGNYESAVILRDYPLWTAKWDGSVPGYEMVSEPMSYDHWMDEADLSFIPELRNAGMKAGRNGLHVHISRNGFVSDWHRAKFVKLWMEASNYEEVRAFNRRHCGEYASPITNLTAYQMARRIGVEYGTRYCMLNVQNRETIEMRGPASTLNRLKIRGTIAGFAAAVEYTRVMSMQQVALGGLQWSGLVQWAQERPEYAAFVAYLDILIEEGAPKSVRAARELVLA